MEWKCVCVCDPFRGITRKVMIFVCLIFCSFFVKAAPHTTTVSMELISFFIGLLSEKSRPAFISFHSQTKNVFVCSAQLLKHTNTHMLFPLFYSSVRSCVKIPFFGKAQFLQYTLMTCFHQIG